MISKYYRAVLIVVVLGALVGVPMVNAYPTPAGNVSQAIDHAKQAVAHGKEGHVDELVKHAETALDFAEMGGKGVEVREGIHHLKEAIAHGKAGHADVGIEHLEAALKHLSEIN
ncbi:MAG: hypothetical protein BVN28_00090 [Nitrospira sp. ST-bin4]|jgi:hypothetical protein|nr:MAG: hypothetical protein BVN28_00090 [Nitrospira sp. ST-bin4]